MRHHGIEEGELRPALEARLVRRIWGWIRPHRRLLFAGLALLLLASACRLALPWLVKAMIDGPLTEGTLAGLAPLLAAFAGLALLEVLARGLQAWFVDLAGQRALYDLRMALFRHLQRLHARFYDRTPTGRLVGRVTTDIEALQELFSTGVVTILGDLVFLAAALVLVFTLNWRLALTTLLVVPVLLGMTLWIRQRVRRAYIELRRRLSAMNAFLHEHLSGMPVVQLFHREDAAQAGFRVINGEVRRAQLTTVKWESLLSAGTDMVSSLTLALILWYGGGLVLEGAGEPGGGTLTLGALFAFIDYMQKFFQPLSDLSQKYTVLQNAMTASRRIFGLLDVEEELPEVQDPPALPEARGRIEFRDVRFRYGPEEEEEEEVLRGISFRVEPGERVALVGATGAGKTSILKVLTRLYDIQSGSIELDGLDIRRYPLRELRRRLGMVPQDGFLFQADILQNIRLGAPGLGEEEAQRAADRLHLDRMVARFPRGYREPVQERGRNLSAGEKQLISFARALAADPPVLLLDEATSHVDSATEHLLQEAVRELTRGRTSLIVAHRLSTIRDVDRILVLDRGRIAEEGSHEELLRRRGLYWRLVQLQFRDQEAA